MDVKPFDQSDALMTTLRRHNIPDDAARSIVSIQRGPAKSLEAMLLAYDYYLADPGDRGHVSLDDVSRAMQDAAGAWNASADVLRRTQQTLAQPGHPSAVMLASMDFTALALAANAELRFPDKSAGILFGGITKFGEAVTRGSVPAAMAELDTHYAKAQANALAFASAPPNTKDYMSPHDILDAAWMTGWGCVAVLGAGVVATASAPAIVALGIGMIGGAAINAGYSGTQFVQRHRHHTWDLDD